MKVYGFIIVATILFILLGCSGSSDPIAPQPDVNIGLSGISTAGYSSNRYLLGYWNVRVSADRAMIEVVPDRSLTMHLNLVKFLEHTVCTDCVELTNLSPTYGDIIETNVLIRNPYHDDLKMTAFDVRLIFITDSNFLFPVNDRSVAISGDIPILLNPDGYTMLFNQSEYPTGGPGPDALKYFPGKLSLGDNFGATLNPYIAFMKENPRRHFPNGPNFPFDDAEIFAVELPQGPVQFGYAVDACWAPVDIVVDPIIDFPLSANCLEAYIVNAYVDWGLVPGGGSATVGVEVFDHQGVDTIDSVFIEAPDLFSGEIELTDVEIVDSESAVYRGTISNDLGVGSGYYPLLAKVVDTETDPNLGQVNAWDVTMVGIKNSWALTWGSSGLDGGNSVAVDSDGNTYVTGYYGDGVDLDPGAGIDIHSGAISVFLVSFDDNGKYRWARTWVETGMGYGNGVATDNMGNVYVAGSFYGAEDFDPGPGIDEHISSGGLGDAFLSKFTSTGKWVWSRTWGGADYEKSQHVECDETGNVLVTGQFYGTADFDPGPGVDEYTAPGDGSSAFLCKYNTDGDFQYARTWGGTYYDDAISCVADLDSVYVTGYFGDSVDFDPGSGVSEISSIGAHDIYLVKFDLLSGNFQYVRTWGGESVDFGNDVIIGNAGDILVTGFYGWDVDFDPGIGIESRSSNGGEDIYLSCFDSSGQFQWVKTWGGPGDDRGSALDFEESGYIFVSGGFTVTVDFDPGPGDDIHSAHFLHDTFLSKFDSSGNYIWGYNWGSGSDFYPTNNVAVDNSGNSFVTGRYIGITDFDPGPGFDYRAGYRMYDGSYLIKFPPDGEW